MALIDSLTAPFEPEKYKDNYRENLKAMIAAKVEGKETVAAPAAQHLAPVVDILEALKMSLAEGKKPPRSVGGRAVSAELAEAAAAPAAPKKGKKSQVM
jgi:DNA end-binding protein Ku